MDIKQLQRKLKKQAKKLIAQKSKIEQDAAELSAELIKDRTDRGFGVEKQGAPKRKLKKLSESYIRQRAREGLSSKSRLTRTGEMLGSITAKRGKVTLNGARNKSVAKWVADAGRSFFHLSSAEYKKVSNFIREKALKALGL